MGKAKTTNRKTTKKSTFEGKIPAGAVPHLVGQRVYDYLPVFFQALEEMHKELVAIRKAIIAKE